MIGYNKIFFHMSSQGVRTGWGELVRECDAADIPVSVMSVGGEGIGDIISVWDNGSIVPHVPVYRINGADVPPYGADIKPAAAEWWNWQKSSFSPEIIRYHDRIAIKHGNELAKTHSDWLGEFFTEVATLAMNDPDGPFITAPFGWASGEPEVSDWLTPGMVKYLRLADQYPEYVWVCSHEYSYNAADIWAGSPYKVGRFQLLFDVCDQLGLKRPNVVIHEFGWELGSIPSTEEAMRQIDEVAALYAYYPQIKGAGIWTTQPYNNTGIQYKVGALIPHVKELTLSKRYPVGETPPVNPKHKVVVYKLAKEHTKDQWKQIAGIAHDEYKRTQTASHDDAETMYLEGNEESYIVVLDPEFPSQQEAINYFKERGYNYKKRYIFQTEPPDPGTFRYTAWPTMEHRITQHFGEHPDYYGQFGLPGHEGIDIAASLGTAIMSPGEGEVIRATDRSSSGGESNYGWHVIIDHHNGFTTLLAHMEPNLLVSVGDSVLPGQVVGYSGNTGNSTGPHLHLTLKKEGYTYPGWSCCPGYTDPWPYLEPLFIPPVVGIEINLIPYLVPQEQLGSLYEVETKVGAESLGQQRHQSQLGVGSVFYHTKGGDGPDHPAEWEQFDVYGGYIRRWKDTSMGGGKYYELTKQSDNSPFVPWIPAKMKIGQVYASRPLVTVYDKNTCKIVAGPDPTTDYLKLAKHHLEFAGYNEIILQDVVEIHWSKSPDFFKLEEVYYYSKDPRAEGLVGWGNYSSGKLALVSELHAPGQRPDSVRESGCFG